MSTLLGHALLRSWGMDVAWLDARDLLVAQDSEARPERRCSRPGALWRRHRAPADARPRGLAGAPHPGLHARGPGGDQVLGRGGSDTSATLLAARLAVRCEIWTDVPGLFTANPRAVPEARMLRQMDYAEAQETTTGAKVLHPACILPARLAGVPLHIRCT